MIFTLLFIVGLAAFIGWWLLGQGLASKPWLETGAPGTVAETGASSLPTAKIGLGVFLAVAGSLLVLLVSAYTMRMDMEDWRPLPQPGLLWVNTGVLVASSVALHRAQVAARRRGDRGDPVLAAGRRPCRASPSSSASSSPGSSSWRRATA